MTHQDEIWVPGKRVSRADLLLGWLRLGEEGFDEFAALSGFEAPKYRIEFNPPPFPPFDPEPDPPPTPSFPPPPEISPVRYYRVVARKASNILPEPAGAGVSLPDWYDQIQPLDENDTQAPGTLPPDKDPLVAWARLWPVIQALLSQFKRVRQPDIPKLIRIIANGDIPVRIPRKIRQQWAANVQVLVEYSERTELFNEDYNQLLAQMLRLRDSTGFVVQQVLDRLGQFVRIRQGDRYQHRKWHLPESGGEILILSDLGLLDGSGSSQKDWLRFGKKLRAAGFQPLVLLPLPKRYLTQETIAVFDCVCWSRQSDLQPVQWVSKSGGQKMDVQASKDLLAWLSFAVRVEPGLLRAVRHRLPAAQFDVGTEVSAWLHDSVQPTSVGFYFKHGGIEAHRKRFCELAMQQPERARLIVNLVREYHDYVFPTQLHEEILVLADLLDAASLNTLKESFQSDIAKATTHWKRLLKALNEKVEGTAGLPAFTGYYFKRQHPSMWQSQHTKHLPAMWGIMMREYSNLPERLPDFLEGSQEAKRLALSFMHKAADEFIDYVLYQQGKSSLKAATRKRYELDDDGFTMGTPLAVFNVQSQFALNQRQKSGGKTETVFLSLNDEKVHDFQFEEQEHQQIHIAGEELTIECFAKPDWASLIGYDYEKDGALYAEVVNERGEVFRWYWNVPEVESSMKHATESSKVSESEKYHRGFWYPELLKDMRLYRHPAWAAAWNRDQYGLYVDVEIFKIPQRFRWIEPTSFLMGSPEDEAGRYSDETQHPVILSQGYWLAETTCTQSLWEAVMHSNLSDFKGAMRPTENVSWEDIQNFFEQLSKRYPELSLRLPTEAEWENACRAGTTGAFNFDDELSLDKVNYRGTWDDYENWGEGALQKTTDVKGEKYKPNAWGLYQMHGNVWEWCQDWFGDYPAEPVIDPKGPESGDSRVLRGGSWIGHGGRCRSAYRYGGVPSARDYYFGFRLARGHELKSVRIVRVGHQSTGSYVGGAGRGQNGGGLRGAKKSKDCK